VRPGRALRTWVFAQARHRLEHDGEQDHRGANLEIHAATRYVAPRAAPRPAAAAFGRHSPGWLGHYRRMSARSEQMVLDFLRRAADAAHGTLRSDERTRFVASLRASIEQQRRATGAVEPAEVRQILVGFGDPKALVERELRRLHGANGTGATASGAAPPGGTTLNGSVPGGSVPGGRAPDGAVAPGAAAKGAAVPGTAKRGDAAARPAAPLAIDPIAVVRAFARETLAVLLLGLGGLLLPIPLWPIGAAIGMTSRVWRAVDKFTGIAGPLIITVGGVGVIGALNKNPSIPVDLHAYVAAARADGPLLMRAGAAAGAAFLSARLPRARLSQAGRSADRRRHRAGGR
jgi:hypothetical protein